MPCGIHVPGPDIGATRLFARHRQCSKTAYVTNVHSFIIHGSLGPTTRNQKRKEKGEVRCHTGVAEVTNG